MKPRTLCCYALPIKLGLNKPYAYTCSTCGLTTRQVGNKKLYLKVQRNIKEFLKNAPKDYEGLEEYARSYPVITKK